MERFFSTLRVGLLQELPGCKGQDILARGVSPEQDAWFYLDELEAIIRECIAVIYHHSAHAPVARCSYVCILHVGPLVLCNREIHVLLSRIVETCRRADGHGRIIRVTICATTA